MRERKKSTSWRRVMLALCVLAAMWSAGFGGVEAAGIPTAPGITAAPDGLAFTTGAGDRSIESHSVGERVNTGVPSLLRALTAGEHYYLKPRDGDIPIGAWNVVLASGRCIHDDYPKESTYHGIAFSREKCGSFYKTGWMASCADCGERLNILIYMDEATARGLTALPADINYYYLCPHCDNLEQGRRIAHDCKAVSANRYYVTYRKNAPNAVGYMERSTFFYGNADLYEGRRVTGEVRLRENSFARDGYVFDGWNTAPDGTGRAFADGEEILNLTTENEDMIVLYAMWKRSTSTLIVDGGEGLYDGVKRVTVTKDYGSQYLPQAAKVTPPEGYLVTFQSMGGGAVPAIRERQRVVGFVQGKPFYGSFMQGVYHFTGPDGSIDVLTAMYEHSRITLPNAVRQGYSFGGWYKDRNYSEFVGTAGDTYLPSGNVTLYAKWVDLLLASEDNYRAYGGSGAADLSWEQKDEKNKIYLLYRSTDGRAFERIYSGQDTALDGFRKDFAFIGGAQQFLVPESGYYDIEAFGAQGEDYSDGSMSVFRGGLGGRASERVFLEKGEQLTVTVGGRNGYPDAGAGDPYGGGGGMSSVTSNEKGILLAAGGGGGASPRGNGEAGGSMEHLRPDKVSAGESGMIGGGSGYIGGKAGEYLVHSHTEDCFRQISTAYEVFFDKRFSDPALFRGSLYGEELWGNELQENGRRVYAHTLDRNDKTVMGYLPGRSVGPGFLPVDDNTALSIDVELYAWGDKNNYFLTGSEDTYLKVYDQNHRLIFSKSAGQIPAGNRFYAETSGDAAHRGYVSCTESAMLVLREEGDYGGWDWVKFTESVELPRGTTGVYLDVRMSFLGYAHMQMTFERLAFTGGSYPVQICPYSEGQVLSASPAGGGSNFGDLKYALSYTGEAGVHEGDGKVTITAHSVGFQSGGSLMGVAAPDLAPPDGIDEAGIVRVPVVGDTVEFSWNKPTDNGTTYFFKAESYSADTGEKLCDSNTVQNHLVSGVKQYLYLADRKENTVVTAENGRVLPQPRYLVTLSAIPRFLHIAPVDAAGNVGPTTHIRLQAEDPLIPWEIFTKKLTISGEEGNVYRAGDDVFYVRADGSAPFALAQGAYSEHSGAGDRQIDRLLLLAENAASGASQILTCDLQKCDPTIAAITLTRDAIASATQGEEFLQDAAFTEAVREDSCKKVTLNRQFTLPAALQGQTFRLTPVAAAGKEDNKQYSDPMKDRGNGITVIADGEAPRIAGAEQLESRLLAFGGAALDGLTLRANDAHSGVRSFEVTLFEREHYLEKTYTSNTGAGIRIELGEDSLFRNGDVTVTIRAVDNVGNEAVYEYESSALTVEARIERILAPGGTVFKTGESGILYITVTGGARRLEIVFPEEMTTENPALNRSIEIAVPTSPLEKQLQFMVPLGTPENANYHVIVRAMKDGRTAEATPVLSVISSEGGVLEELRTRLR